MSPWSRHLLSLFITIFLHSILLLLFNWTPAPHTAPISNGYVFLDIVHQDQQDQQEQHSISEKHKQPELPPQKITPLPKPRKSLSPKPIDKRGIYNSTTENHPAQPLLNMEGWIWDTLPKPKDSTLETGTIVFSITVDDWGEVIAVRLLESNVDTAVSQIYQLALMHTTFKKTAPQANYSPTTTGRVTFILKPV